MISGCDRPWTLWTSWPGPYMVLNTDGLGTGPIGNYLRKDQWGHSEVDLEHGIAELINERSSTKAISREDAESLGVQCAPAPSTECSYSGELWFRVGPLPPESPHYGKRTVVNIQVRFSYLKLRELVVRKRERDIPEDDQVNNGG